MRKILLLVVFSLIFSGCKNMYSKIFDKEEAKKIYCLNVEGKDMFLNTKVEKYLKENGFRLEKNCPYRLEVFALKLSQCNSPKGKSLGADFDGYIRFSVYKGDKLIYRCQEDYKGEFGDYLIKDLARQMKKDLENLK